MSGCVSGVSQGSLGLARDCLSFAAQVTIFCLHNNPVSTYKPSTFAVVTLPQFKLHRYVAKLTQLLILEVNNNFAVVS
jgi:hypothetical protein